MWLRDVTLFSLRRPRKFGRGAVGREDHISEGISRDSRHSRPGRPFLTARLGCGPPLPSQEWPAEIAHLAGNKGGSMGRPTRVLCDGIYFGEGPRWRDDRLWFSDFFARAVKSVLLTGDVRTEFEIDDMPSGLGWMPDGSLLVVSMIKRRLLRRSPDGEISVHADLCGIADFHCNDMVVDRIGRAYVGNFGFDLY